MGDSRAPGKDREAAAKASAAALTSENSPSSRPSGPVPVKSSIPARPVTSVIPEAKVTSTAPPATEDIDSEWPDEPPASDSSAGALAPATDEVDSGWQSDDASAAEPPVARGRREFPSHPALPNELWRGDEAQSRRGAGDSKKAASANAAPAAEPAPVAGTNAAAAAQAAPSSAAPSSAAPSSAAPSSARSAEDASSPSEPPRAGAAKPRAAEPEPESTRASTAPPRSRGKTLVLAAAAVVAATFWFTRAGNRASEEPSVEAARPEAVAPLAARPEASAASPSGVEAPPAAAPLASANTGEPSAAPAASAEASSGKIVVIVNVRPPQARIYYRGKEAGKAPLRVELEPGKRRAFEVGSPGFMTRKVVVDGSKPEVLVGLRPASPYAASSPPAARQN